MNRHVGASFTLSVLVVVFFAVVLYQPEQVRRVRSGETAKPSAADTHQTASNESVPPAPTPGIPLIEAEASDPPASEAFDPPTEPRRQRMMSSHEPQPSHPLAHNDPPHSPEGRSEHRTTARVTPRPNPLDPPAPIQTISRRRELGRTRRSAFTEVEAGESLADVAIRIYGTSEATRTLWLANRDILDRRDAPLDPGILLRTP